MRRFTKLFRELDESSRVSDKEDALVSYLCEAPSVDAAWAIWFLWGNRLKLGIPSKQLKQWASDLTGFPDWLVEACNKRVGDLAETASLLLPLQGGSGTNHTLTEVVEDQLMPLGPWDERFQFQLIKDFWTSLTRDEALVISKLLTGTLRMGLSRLVIIRALSVSLHRDPEILARRLDGKWEPNVGFFQSLKDEMDDGQAPSLGDSSASLSLILEDLADDQRVRNGEAPRHSALLVLIYAHAQGGRETPYTGYTLAARAKDKLTALVKVDPGLTDTETGELDEWIKEHTLARLGPVRTVPPELIFEIGFEGIRASARHKGGMAMRFPRILRWGRDKQIEDIDGMDGLRALLDG